MSIEFQTHSREVPEWVISDLTKKLMGLYRKNKNILHVQVSFNKRVIAFDGDYICEIELTIPGNSIMVQRNARSYAHAASEALDEILKIADEHTQLKEPVLR